MIVRGARRLCGWDEKYLQRTNLLNRTQLIRQKDHMESFCADIGMSPVRVVRGDLACIKTSVYVPYVVCMDQAVKVDRLRYGGKR
jgi:hypothetical protein